MMKQRVVRLESATYEIIECEHDVDQACQPPSRARKSCATRSARSSASAWSAVVAALKAGCHHLDTTGEQGYCLEARERFGQSYAEAGLVLSPSVSYMYTIGEIAAELALETPGVDALETASLSRGPMQGSGVTVGSTASIFELFRSRQLHLWDNQMVEWPVGSKEEICVPEFLKPVFCLPWGGTSLPVFYERDPRVRYCRSMVGFYDNPAMRNVHALGRKWEEEFK